MAKIIDTLVTRFTFVTDSAALGAIESRLHATRAKLNTLSTQALVVGAAAAGGLATFTQAGITTDRAINMLRTTLGLTADEAQRFYDQALEVGANLPVNTEDIIQAQDVIAKFGKSVEETLDFTPFVVETSVAAGLKDQIPDVALWALQAEANLELSNEELKKFMGQLIHIGKIAPGSFGEVGAAFGASIGNVKRAGLSNEEYIATLANLKTAGVEIPTASRGLNAFMLKLSDAMSGIGEGATTVPEALSAVNITIEELREMLAQENGFIRLLDTIYQRAPDESTLTSAIGRIVGQEYAAPFAGVASRAGDVLADIYSLMPIGAEAVAKDVGILMSGVSGAWDTLVAQLDTVRNSMFEVIDSTGFMTRAFAVVADAMAELVRKYEDGENKGEFVHRNILDLIAASLKWGTALIGVSFALKALTFILGGLVPIMRAISFVTGLFTTATATSTAATAAGTAAIGAKTVAVRALGIAMRALPWVAVASAIAAVIVYWKDIVDWVKKAATAISDFFELGEKDTVTIKRKIVNELEAEGGIDTLDQTVDVVVHVDDWKLAQDPEERFLQWKKIQDARQREATDDWKRVWIKLQDWWNANDDIAKPAKPISILDNSEPKNWWDRFVRYSEQITERNRTDPFANVPEEKQFELRLQQIRWDERDNRLKQLFADLGVALQGEMQVWSAVASLEWQTMLNDWSARWEIFKSLFDASAWAEVIIAQFEEFSTRAGMAWDMTVDAWTAKWQSFIDFFKDGWNSLTEWFDTTIVDWFSGFDLSAILPSWLQTAFETFSPSLATATAGNIPATINGRSPQAVQSAVTNQVIANETQANRNVTVGDLTVNVNASGGDSKEIAENVGAQLRDQFLHLVDSADSRYSR